MKAIELHKLGDIIKSKRLSKSLTQVELTYHSGIDRNYIGMVEYGERNPSDLSLLKTAKGLNMPFHELLTP